MHAFALNAERVAAFAVTGERRKQEERVVLVRDSAVALDLSTIDLHAHEDPQRAAAAYALLKSLLQDEAVAAMDG